MKSQLQSQLLLEMSNGCPKSRVKYNFTYLPNDGSVLIDTLIPVDNYSFIYPLTNTDKLALAKVDSAISVQDARSLYPIKKINLKGYRKQNQFDKVFMPPLFKRKALK